MSSSRNAIQRRTYKERAQPHARRKFGLLEKHKDYVERARSFHKKEQTLQNLKLKAALRNPDEFYFKMIKSKSVGGVHRAMGEANKYSKEQLMLMKTQDIGYIRQKLQSEKKKTAKLNGALHSLDNCSSSKHVYYAENRSYAREIRGQSSKHRENHSFEDLPTDIKRKTSASYRELECRRNRVTELEKTYNVMSMQKELQKKDNKRKLGEDEIICPTSGPVYKWRQERKR